ncbi:Branchpoint-bridging protein, partial [Neolecta irregularis DAH-3]
MDEAPAPHVQTRAAPPPPAVAANGQIRGRSPVRSGRVKKKRNRWGAAEDNKALGLIGLPTAITSTMTTEQIEAYALHIRLEEIGQKLRIGDVTPPEKDRRSVSPPPQYDNFGRRINTRESRYRKKLEDERHRLIEKAMRTIPDFKPPADYRRPTKTQEKIYIPVNDASGGFGYAANSTREGGQGAQRRGDELEPGGGPALPGDGGQRGQGQAGGGADPERDRDGGEHPGDAERPEAGAAARAGDAQRHAARRREPDVPELYAAGCAGCAGCGNIGHRRYDCPEIRNYSANIVCRACGQAGHIMKDCPEKPDAQRRAAAQITSAADREYESLMQELGGGGGGGHSDGRLLDAGSAQSLGQTPWAQPANPWAKALPAAPHNPWGSAPPPQAMPP